MAAPDSRSPLVAALFEAVRALGEGPEELWTLAPAFARFVAADPLVPLLATKLGRLLTRPGDTLNLQPGLSWRVGGLPAASLFLRVLLPADYDPEDAPAHRLWASADGAPLKLRRHAVEGLADPDVLDPALHLGPAREELLPAGETARLPARTEVVIPDVERVRLVWELCAAPLYGQRWIYDPETLRPRFAMTASRALTQLDYALAVLRDTGDARALPVLAEYARAHPAHFIRYRACEAACAVAPARAGELLRALADDPHPDLRAVAQTALEADDGR